MVCELFSGLTICFIESVKRRKYLFCLLGPQYVDHRGKNMEMSWNFAKPLSLLGIFLKPLTHLPTRPYLTVFVQKSDGSTNVCAYFSKSAFDPKRL